MTLRLLDEANYDAEMESKVLPALDACMTEGWMDPATVDWNGDALAQTSEPNPAGCTIAVTTRPNSMRCVRTALRACSAVRSSFRMDSPNSREKYSEMAWYFLLAGYSVCILEHRGHGHSVHDVSNPSLVWIDDWRRYVADFAAFADTVGREYACGEPLNLYCHSMGGGIGAAVMEHYPSLFDKAVLSAPMIAPVVGMPTWIARIATGALCGLGFGKARVFGHTDFSPELDLDEHKGASEARVRWFHKQRVDDVACQTNAATFEWAHQAMALSRAVLKPDMCGAIETPTLLFQAGRDVWVLNGPQDDFVERVREGGGSIEKNTVRQVVARDLLHAEHGGRTVCEQDSRLPQRARRTSL